MTSMREGLQYENLVISDTFKNRHSKLFNSKTLTFLRKGNNKTFGDFELMTLKRDPEVINHLNVLGL